MGIRRRSAAGEKFDIVVSIERKRQRISTVVGEMYAIAISDLAKDVIDYSKHSAFACSVRLRTLQTLNSEAYESLRAQSHKFDLVLAEEHEHQEWLSRQVWEQDRIERKSRELMEAHLSKLSRIASAPVPVSRIEPYPEPPQSLFAVTKDGDGLPSDAGVYFVWSDGSCAYVGQSIRIKSRAKLGHERIVASDRISYLLFDPSELLFAESYYIGIMRPQRNFRGFRRESIAFNSDIPPTV